MGGQLVCDGDVEPRCVFGDCSRKAGVEQRCVVKGCSRVATGPLHVLAVLKMLSPRRELCYWELQMCRREVDRQSVDEVIVIYDRGSVASCLFRTLRLRSMARKGELLCRLIELVVCAVDDLTALVPVVSFRHRRYYPRLCCKCWAPDVLANQGLRHGKFDSCVGFCGAEVGHRPNVRSAVLGSVSDVHGLLLTLRVGRPQNLSARHCGGESSLACTLPCSVEQSGEAATVVASTDVGSVDGVSGVAASSVELSLVLEPVPVLCVALQAFPFDGFVVDGTTQYLTFETNALVYRVGVCRGSTASASWRICGGVYVWWHPPTWSWGTCGRREGWFPTDYVLPFPAGHAV